MKRLVRQPIEFSVPAFKRLADSLSLRQMKTERVTISDEAVVGLRCIIRNTGAVSFHVQYSIAGARPYLKIGDVPGTTVDQARKLARTVLDLAKQGVDPQVGLHDRLIRELTEKGAAWRP